MSLLDFLPIIHLKNINSLSPSQPSLLICMMEGGLEHWRTFRALPDFPVQVKAGEGLFFHASVFGHFQNLSV